MMTVGHDPEAVGYVRATVGYYFAVVGYDPATTGHDLTAVGHGLRTFLASKIITIYGGIEDGCKQGLYPQKH